MSTVEAPLAVDSGDDGAEPVERTPNHVRPLVFRWVLLGLCVIAAFFPTWRRLAKEASDGAITAYIFILPFLAAIAAQGIARRRGAELPIHDRQTDNICGGIGLLAAIAIQGLWLPRYADQYALAHLDVLAGVVFTMSGAVLLFGLRPVGRFWSVWLLLLMLSPLGYRMIAIALGGSRFDYGSVMVLLAGVAGGIAVGRTKRRAIRGSVTTVAVGLAILWAMLELWPTLHIAILQFVSAIGSASATGLLYFLHARRGRSKKYLAAPVTKMSAKRSVSAKVSVVLAAIVLFALPLPASDTSTTSPGPPGPVDGPLSTPDGWTRTSIESYPWVTSFFGRSSTLVRQSLVAEQGNPDWDEQSRPRTVMVDVLSTTNKASLVVYPESTLYRLADTRTSNALSVRLGHDVVGSLYTSVDDTLLLTWTKLVFQWERSGVVQRVTVISVDNHDEGALFPVPAPSMASNLSSSIGTFLRGNKIATNDDPDFKDRTLLTALATDLVDEQWPRTGSGR
ncbi:hypothetical protein GCM10007304_47850 [Rhodococcoides trifolii]|uniref:Exosortase/archaeosortase family protein n=1 Tax=Rhodococcoides trifolii TaxID=908250 RepID=A0A917G862_9NOCA|nr:hypothetical protein [Rhodococcus trifolii]GGG28413.1 hypothetical protein GCM10007304_47850 [Rhodococcus trifolii]